MNKCFSNQNRFKSTNNLNLLTRKNKFNLNEAKSFFSSQNNLILKNTQNSLLSNVLYNAWLQKYSRKRNNSMSKLSRFMISKQIYKMQN